MSQAQTIPEPLKVLRKVVGRTSLTITVKGEDGKSSSVDAWTHYEAIRNANRGGELSMSDVRSGTMDDLLQRLLTTRPHTILVNGDVPDLLDKARHRGNDAQAETARRILEVLDRHAKQFGTKVVYDAKDEPRTRIGRGHPHSRAAMRAGLRHRADGEELEQASHDQLARLAARRDPHKRIKFALSGDDTGVSSRFSGRKGAANGNSEPAGEQDISVGKPVENLEGQACAPLFDTIDNAIPVNFSADGGKTGDVTPPPPILTDFDRSVLEICPRIGADVSFDQVNGLLIKYPDILNRIMATTGGVVRFGDAAFTDPKAYREALVKILVGQGTERNWFRHVMAGELKQNGTIGGLHFPGVIYQAQQNGELCRLAPSNNTITEVEHGRIYSVGLRSGKHSKRIGGYAWNISADQLIEIAAFAFATNRFASEDKTSGVIVPVTTSDGHTMYFVVASRNSALVTTYSDATPGNDTPKANKPLKLSGQHGGPESLAAAKAAALANGADAATKQAVPAASRPKGDDGKPRSGNAKATPSPK